VWTQLTEQKMTPEQVVESWKPQLDEFKALRKKHLLY